MLIHILLPQSFVKKARGDAKALKSYFILKGIHNFCSRLFFIKPYCIYSRLYYFYNPNYSGNYVIDTG